MDVVSIEFNKQRYEGQYFVVDGVLTVYGHAGSEITSLGGSDPEPMARILLRRLAERGEVDPLPD